jgi:hypothetical protein
MKNLYEGFVLQYLKCYSLFSFEAEVEMVHHGTFNHDALNFGANFAMSCLHYSLTRKGIPLYFSMLRCFSQT